MSDLVEQTINHVKALTGDGNAVLDWRIINDKDKGEKARNIRGTLKEVYGELVRYNNAGYGIFACINEMDGHGRDYSNVRYIRAHVVDLDDVYTSAANYQKAVNSGATFSVQSSQNKYHVYWIVEPYAGNECYNNQQRKLNQLFGGDKTIIDPTRVMRMAGFYHHKGEPQLVTFTPLSNTVYNFAQIDAMTQHVNVIEHYSQRSELGTPELQAPSLEWLQFALSHLDPNEMDRGEWMSVSAAFKQAGWSHADEDTLYDIWSKWCTSYTDGNDEAENRKLWKSFRDTQVGWKTFQHRTPVKAYEKFGFKEAPTVKNLTDSGQNFGARPDKVKSVDHTDTYKKRGQEFGEILTEYDQKDYFKDCYFVERTGEMFTPSGRFMKASQFNGTYGGKQFIITSTGKTTDEAWKAATRSTCWTIPKVDHVRFLPDRPQFDIVDDSLGRRGLNTYIPARIKSKQGDVHLWLDHVNKILPNADDQRVLFEFMAHAVKYKGFKIPWAPLLQSAEGVGKTVFYELMQHALGDMYVYSPKAPELIKSGSTFNAWMRAKLMIIVNEIKIDERRELIEILKPMITDARVEIQAKGVDQDIEDNPANWFFFTNHRDAIPVNQNGRRYAILYSALSNKNDIIEAGMNKTYFDRLFKWLREEDGFEAVTHWLMNYPIAKGEIPVRAPETSSYLEAIKLTRSPLELLIDESVQDGISGFIGGYVSTTAVLARTKLYNIRGANTRTVQNCLEGAGYVHLGRSNRSYMQESPNMRSEIYGVNSSLVLENFGKVQGYE